MKFWKKKPASPVMVVPGVRALPEGELRRVAEWYAPPSELELLKVEHAALKKRYAALLAKVAEAEVRAGLADAERLEWRRKAIDDDYRRRRDAGAAAPIEKSIPGPEMEAAWKDIKGVVPPK